MAFTEEQLVQLRHQMKAFRMLFESYHLLASDVSSSGRGAYATAGRGWTDSGVVRYVGGGLRYWSRLRSDGTADGRLDGARGANVNVNDQQLALALQPKRRSSRLGGQSAKRYVDELPENLTESDVENDGSTARRSKRSKYVEGGMQYDAEVVNWSRDTPPLWEPVRHAGAAECCSICGDIDADADNVFIYCDGIDCHNLVHLQCHGLDEIPTGEWYCDTCAANLPANRDARCALCPVVGGAMRRVTGMAATSRPWCHIACALWNPEVSFDKPRVCEGVNLDQVARSRLSLVCELCKQSGGGAIQCHFPRCCRAFHPLCARAAGWILAFTDSGDAVGFCQEHSRQKFDVRRTNLLSPPEPASAASPAATVGPSQPPPVTQLSEYELERQRNIERNKQMMARLGINMGSAALPSRNPLMTL